MENVAEKLRSLAEKSPGVPMGSIDSKLRRKDQVGVRIQMHQRLFADLQAKHIFLVDRNPDLHDGRVHHLHERNAGTHLIALLHLAHISLLPDGVENHDAVDGRVNLHQGGVGLRMQHGFAGAVALNFKDADGGLRGLSLQVEGLLQLRQRGLRFVQVFLRLFGIDAGQQLDLLHLQLGLGEIVFGLLDLGLVLGAGGVFLGLCFNDLFIQSSLCACLSMESRNCAWRSNSTSKVSLLDARSAGNQLGDRECAHLLAGDEGSLNGSRFNRGGHALEANSLSCRGFRSRLPGRARSLGLSVYEHECENGSNYRSGGPSDDNAARQSP